MSIIQTFFQGSDLFIEITSNKENLDLRNEIGSTLYDSSQTKRVIIPSSVSVGSTVVSDAALKIPSGVGGSLYIDNYGSILGAGGSATAGNGGDAILTESRCTINNKPNGSIYAGGGGGGTGGTGGTGGQGSVTVITGSYPVCTWSGRYGCYAYGTAYNYGTSYTAGGSGGSGGTGGRGRGYNQTIASGISGAAGSAGGQNAGPGGTGGTGGSGGDWGTNGSTGNSGNTGVSGNYTAGSAGTPGSAGGISGNYINGSPLVQFTNNGSVAGRTT
jgi:hypothetical protein